MNYLLKIACLFSLSLPTYSYSVALGDSSEPAAYLKSDDGTNYSLLVKSAGDAKRKDTAASIYFPYKLHAGYSTSHYEIPDAQMILGGSTSANAGITFDLGLADDNRSDLHLNVAVRKSSGSDTEYIVVKRNMSQSTPYLKLSEICGQTNELSNCTDLNDAAKLNAITQETYFYIFYSLDNTSGVNIGDTMNPATTGLDNGVFFRMYFSNDLVDYATAATRIQNQEIYRGDSSLYIDYQGVRNDSTVDRIAAFGKKNSETPTEDHFYQMFTKAELAGQVLVTKLTNTIEYCFVLRYIDRYGFKSKTDEAIGSNCAFPTEIKTLLKEKSCYFVTAGFGREHYVLEYFRYIRDEYLMNSLLGNAFINFYYSTAPQYAHYIYESSTFSFIVRGVSYTFYYLLNYFTYIASSIVALFLVALRIKKKNVL